MLDAEIRFELWRRGELSYKLHDGQRKIYDSLGTSSEVLIFCSRQFGKSYLSVILALEYCLKHPGSIVRIAAPTLKQVKDIVNDNITPICSDAPNGLIVRQKSEYRWQVGKSSLRLGSLERANSDSLRGGNASLFICEEGGFVASDDYAYAVSSVIGPQLLRSRGRLVHVTTPSKEPEHNIHMEVLNRTQETDSFYKFTVHDNPQLTPEHIAQAMRLAGGADSEDWKREYLCEILRSVTLVCVPEFDAVAHIKTCNDPQMLNTLVSTDVGGVKDKTASLFMGYNPITGVNYVLREFVAEPNTSSDVIIAGIRNLGVANMHYADGHGQQLIDWEQLHGYSATLPLKDDWRAGLNHVRMLLREGLLFIHPDCTFLIRTLKGATFNKDRTDYARSHSLGHMDALAALSYGMRMMDRYTLPKRGVVARGDKYLMINPQEEETGKHQIARLFK